LSDEKSRGREDPEQRKRQGLSGSRSEVTGKGEFNPTAYQVFGRSSSRAEGSSTTGLSRAASSPRRWDSPGSAKTSRSIYRDLQGGGAPSEEQASASSASGVLGSEGQPRNSSIGRLSRGSTRSSCRFFRSSMKPKRAKIFSSSRAATTARSSRSAAPIPRHRS